jgi:prepilin-type N-terminal cleavage/methylation domain-containing protein
MQIANCKLKSEERTPHVLPSAFCTLHSRRPSSLTPRPSPVGFTLVELLIVIVILGVVTAASIPVVLPALASRGVREAGRILNAHFGSAQALAMANGRSAGVWIERLSNATTTGSANDGAMDVYLAEVPQPYSGDQIGSTVQIQVDNTQTPHKYTIQFTSDSSWQNLPLRPGDLIRFNYQGHWYCFPGSQAAYPGQYTNTVTTDTWGNQALDATPSKVIDRVQAYWSRPADCPMPQPSSNGVPYQILRQPVKSAGSPTQLPTGTVIDLGYSGTTSAVANLSGKDHVVITFNKSGALENLYYTDTSGSAQIKPLIEPLFLLIGKRDQLGSLSAGGTPWPSIRKPAWPRPPRSQQAAAAVRLRT